MLQGALAGLAIGGVYAVIAVCLTLMARLVRVINFAQAVVGMFGAFLAAGLARLGMPDVPAIIIGIAVGTALSGVIGLVISTWLPEATTSARSAVTVAALLTLLTLSYIIFGTDPLSFTVLVSGPACEVGGVIIGNITIVMIVMAVGVAVAAKLILDRTRIGIRLRAVADRPVTAELVGIRVGLVTQSVWLLSGLVVSIAIMIVAPAQTSDAFSLSMLVINAAAAALLGGFRRLDVALASGLLLGMLQGAIAQYADLFLLGEWLPLVVIVLLLLWNQRKVVWDAAR
ncbi:branched-chain amino acid ABC transporter permease [uncultured Microbacterium sp.]|uniref:branched-chain amino acid ABC transporter permease n=1 Tax=uncultured Microbacterium sp. TaxID=191216 RepID=UPI0035CC3EAD